MNSYHAQEAFDGLMLSDGSLRATSMNNACMQVALSGAEHLDWLYFIKDNLELLGVSFNPPYPKVYKVVSSKGIHYDHCVLLSRTSGYLGSEHKKWYNGSRKIVPANISITPVVLANWFMGDGSSSRVTSFPRCVKVFIATSGFRQSEVCHLASLLALLGIKANVNAEVRDSKTYYRIGVQDKKSVNILMELIEPHVLPSYRYKIKKALL